MLDSKNHLLIITDDQAMRKTIEGVAAEMGFVATWTDDQTEAHECLEAGTVDLIVCERLMPRFDTFLFAEQVMFDARHRHIPMMYLAPEGLVVEEMKARSDIEIVLLRPVTPLKLVAGIATLLERGAIYTHVMREDSLTRLLNRQTLQTEVERELNRVRRYQGMGCLIFLDVDNFKKVNDQLGHAVGDQVLEFLADKIRQNIRNIDLAGRHGGEEFLIYLPETPEEGALAMGRRLLEVCRTAGDGPEGVHLTFSAGVIEVPRDGHDFDVIVERADQAMYCAKSQGKARVLSWREVSELAQASEG